MRNIVLLLLLPVYAFAFEVTPIEGTGIEKNEIAKDGKIIYKPKATMVKPQEANIIKVNNPDIISVSEPKIVMIKSNKPKCEVKEENINLSADALFRFNKYSQKDLLAKGRQQLNQLAQSIAKNYSHIEYITVVGHTDRLGKKAYNDKLGLNRAKTVRSYLLAQGGIRGNINVKSQGSRQPVTDGCHQVTARKQLQKCLQPDRRVEVKVLGVKKTTQCTKVMQ